MRIGIAVYGSLETLSGGYLYDRQMVNYLQSQGDEIEIVSLPWQNYFFHLSQNFTQSYLEKFYDLDIDIYHYGHTKIQVLLDAYPPLKKYCYGVQVEGVSQNFLKIKEK